jgi:predicted Zn-dependent peptidase
LELKLLVGVTVDPHDDHRTYVQHADWLRTTTICVGISRGSRDDPGTHAGAAHMLEHLVMSCGGENAVATRVERSGGTSNATTGQESTLYAARVYNDDAALIAAVLCDAVEHPRVRTEDFRRERGVVAQELAAAAADPWDVVQEAFLAELFGCHPLGRPVGGTMAGIDAFDLEAAGAYLASTTKNPRYASVVGGSITSETLDRLHAFVAGAGSATLAAEAYELPPVGGVGRACPDWPAGDYCWLVAGGHGVPASDPDRFAFEVLAALMNGSPASLLYRELRDRAAVAYTFQAWNSNFRDAGAFRVLAGVEPANGTRATDVIVALLERIARDGPTAAELDDAVRRHCGQLVRDLEDPWHCALEVTSYAGSTGVVRAPHDDISQVEAVTPENVAAAAAKVIASLLVVVHPSGEPR